MNKTVCIFLALVFVTALAASCTSRYILDFYLVSGEKRQKVNVEQTQYAAMTVLASPYAENKIIQGLGNTLMIGTGSRGQREAKTSEYDVFGFDEYLRYRIYVQLPVSVQKGSLPLQGNSFVELMGRYDQAAELHIFTPQSGNFVVDSIASPYLFATVQQGVFANSAGSQVTFEGRIKAKVVR